MKKLAKLGIIPITLLAMMPVYAAKPVNLMQQPISSLSSFMEPASPVQVTELNRSIDFNQTLHVRIQQTYKGYPVWGADAVLHLPKGEKSTSLNSIIHSANTFANGQFYADIAADLTTSMQFSQAQAKTMLQHAISAYQQKIGGTTAISNESADLIVYVDKNKKAHWAYKVSFMAAPTKANTAPAKPVYIIDATTYEIYAQWNDIKTALVDGGGFGGNLKMGKLVYDGLPNHLAKLKMTRKSGKCYLQNTDVNVKSEKSGKVINFVCLKRDTKHNNLFWDGDKDKVNGGYSPGNDALFGGMVIKNMYHDWYHVPVLTNEDGTPMMLNMVVHSDMDNAYWDGQRMVFGDGVDMFYPLTSIGVASHEISHGFTEQHSNLVYDGQSGGMNEAFSDMAAQAAEVYAYGPGKNSWQIGPEIFKAANEALRYMDKPSKDCGKGRKPGDWCSIDDASQYDDSLDVHFSSGVYNHFFYALGTTANWDAKKAFDVMVQANSHYWTASATFVSGACGVMQAAKDLDYSIDDVKAAFGVVKIDTSSCKLS